MEDGCGFSFSDSRRSRQKPVSRLRRSLSAGSENYEQLHQMEHKSRSGLVKQAVAGLKKWRAHPLAFFKTRKKKEKSKKWNGSIATSSLSQQLQVPSGYDRKSKYAEIPEENVHDKFPWQQHHNESDVRTGKQAPKKNNKNNLQGETDKGGESPPALMRKIQPLTESISPTDEGPGIDDGSRYVDLDDSMEELTRAEEFDNDKSRACQSNQGNTGSKAYIGNKAQNLGNSSTQAMKESESESSGGKLEARRKIPGKNDASTILPNLEIIYKEAAGKSSLPKKGVDKAERLEEVPRQRHEHGRKVANATDGNQRLDAKPEHLTKQMSEKLNENFRMLKDQACMKPGHSDPSNNNLEDEIETRVKVEDNNDHSIVVNNDSNEKAKVVENFAVQPFHKKPADADLNWQTDQLATEKESEKLKSRGNPLTKTADCRKSEPLNLAESRKQAHLQRPSNLYNELEAKSEGNENLHKEDLDFQHYNVHNPEDPANFMLRRNTAHQTPQNCKAKQEETFGSETKNREPAVKRNDSAVPIHDFCLGIPYGSLLIVESFLWFMATWNTFNFHFEVLLGVLVLAFSILSLKAWSEGCSSRAYIKPQSVIACIILARDLPNVLKTTSFSSHAFVCFISLAMICFYAHVYSLGEIVKDDVKQ